jgi:hypothetical protein
VQSAHAAINFVFEHPSRAGPWHSDSNYLVLLSVDSEADLNGLINQCLHHNILYTAFREPDIGDQLTAVAIEPSQLTKKVTRNIPLLFKELNNDTA